MGLDFFNDVKCPLYKRGFEIIFNRADDHFAIIQDTTDPRAKIVVDEFIVRVPILIYDDLSKVQILNELLVTYRGITITNSISNHGNVSKRRIIVVQHYHSILQTYIETFTTTVWNR